MGRFLKTSLDELIHAALAGTMPSRHLTSRALIGISTCLVATLLLSACAEAPKGPLIGTWQGQEGGNTTATLSLYGTQTLTLYGDLNAGAGQYDISTLTNYGGSHGSDYQVWSGSWSSVTKTIDGHPEKIIYLKGALNDEIDRYKLDQAGNLEPTSEFVGRPLTRQEISLYSMYPLGRGA